MGELGERAEREVEARIRAALPDGARCFANVRWLAPTRRRRVRRRNGEIDLLLVLPAIGILVIETKGGLIVRDRGPACGSRATGSSSRRRSSRRRPPARAMAAQDRGRPALALGELRDPSTPSPSRTPTATPSALTDARSDPTLRPS